MTRYHLTLKSANHKTGPIPVSTTTADTCSDSCPLRDGGCYAQSGPLALHWKRIRQTGLTLGQFVKAIRALPSGTLWRHNQAGDLPGNKALLDKQAVRQLVEANQDKRGFTYTHYSPLNKRNAQVIREANASGFVVNLSADTLTEADTFAELGIAPVVTLLPTGTDRNTTTPAGRKVVVCPAATHEGVSCAKCKLCAWKDREVIIGFPSHGTQHKRADLVQV
jgi:hypothetical protein